MSVASDSLKNLLGLRAKTSLLNPFEVTDDVLEHASGEALELALGRDIPSAMLLDIAIVRLKLWLKVDVEPSEMTLYTHALKKAMALPLINPNGEKVHVIRVGRKPSDQEFFTKGDNHELFRRIYGD